MHITQTLLSTVYIQQEQKKGWLIAGLHSIPYPQG